MPKFVPIFSQSSQKTDYFKIYLMQVAKIPPLPSKTVCYFPRILPGVCTQKSAAKAALTAPSPA